MRFSHRHFRTLPFHSSFISLVSRLRLKEKEQSFARPRTFVTLAHAASVATCFSIYTQQPLISWQYAEISTLFNQNSFSINIYTGKVLCTERLQPAARGRNSALLRGREQRGGVTSRRPGSTGGQQSRSGGNKQLPLNQASVFFSHFGMVCRLFERLILLVTLSASRFPRPPSFTFLSPSTPQRPRIRATGV